MTIINQNTIETVTNKCKKILTEEGIDIFRRFIIEKQPDLVLFIADLPIVLNKKSKEHYLHCIMYQSYVLREIYASLFNTYTDIKTDEFKKSMYEVGATLEESNGDWSKSYISSIQPLLFDYIVCTCDQYGIEHDLAKVEIGIMCSVLLATMLVLEEKTKNKSPEIADENILICCICGNTSPDHFAKYRVLLRNNNLGGEEFVCSDCEPKLQKILPPDYTGSYTCGAKAGAVGTFLGGEGPTKIIIGSILGNLMQPLFDKLDETMDSLDKIRVIQYYDIKYGKNKQFYEEMNSYSGIAGIDVCAACHKPFLSEANKVFGPGGLLYHKECL